MVSFKKTAKEQSSFPLRFAGAIVRQLPFWVTGGLVIAALLNTIGGGLGVLPGWVERGLDILSNFSAVFLGIFIEAAPFLLMGTLASGLVEAFISRDEIARWVPRGRLSGVLAGSLIGLFFPVCECGVVPFTRRLIHKGFPVSIGITVLLAAPVVNPIVIASTLAAFGASPIFWGRIVLSLLIAVITGAVFSLHPQPAALLRFEEEILARPTLSGLEREPASSFAGRMRQALVTAADEFFEMGRFLILGALLAALLQTFVPQAALLQVGQGPVLSVLAMQALAAMLSICSTVDAFIALAFTGAFSGGAVLAFLVFGPMVDIKSTLMFLRVFKPRTVVFLVVLPLLLTLIAAVFLNYFGRGWGY